MLDALISRFQSLYSPITIAANPHPPAGLFQFIYYFLNQFRAAFLWRFLLVALGAIADALLPIFTGMIIGFMTDTAPGTVFAERWPELLVMAVITIVLRPFAFIVDALIRNHAIVPNLIDLIRWQSHWHVVRQSWSFFQNDFAGRIANKVLQAGDAIEHSTNMLIDAVWYTLVFVIIAIVVLAGFDPLLLVPLLIWLGLFLALFSYVMPRIARRSELVSEAKSVMTGRIVDSYTNIHTLKTFSSGPEEDRYVAASLEAHSSELNALMKVFTFMWSVLFVLNALMMTGVTGLALYRWNNGDLTTTAVATAIPFVLQMVNMSGWILDIGSGVFRDLGNTNDSMKTIARPQSMTDAPGARALEPARGEICYENVGFNYWKGGKGRVIDDFNLIIRPGEKVGLVGRSGSGKSTLVNLLLRLFDVESGRVLIDGQDVRDVTQESLRRAIGLVSQDTSLLHRSVRDNIKYGRPDATEADMIEAARQARIDDVITGLADPAGRTGYDAHVGERGVKLSGGQRQRIAIARVLLKNAPILVLDEATSALDSEVEAAIQEQLQELMEDKTVIAIAHRLSTIAAMDRLVVLDAGRIVEQGTHAELLDRKGHYARLWQRQSGGFLDIGHETVQADA